MQNSIRNPVAHNQQAKLALDYNELLKELSSHKMTSVGCYTIGETIGQGTFGKVKKGYHKLTGKVVAIKKIGKQHAPMMAREIHHHKQIKHPNVVMMYEMITTESAIHIISEYCPNGDLLDALSLSGGRCSEARVHKWFFQLTDAVNYCHLNQIVHRDLKLENVLLDADDNVKICDFGFARFTQKNQYLETFCGSLSYSAPEVISHKKYTGPETDIWSLGVILYTLLAGEFPFDDDSEVITQRKIVQVDYQMPYYFSSKLSNLVQGMLQLEPSHRFTIDNIINHPWMVEIEEHTLEQELTPSSSTSSNNSSLSDLEPLADHIPQLNFSPQTKSDLDFIKKTPRFSAPAFNSSHRTTNASPFRTSLPSLNKKSQDMTPTEQRLLTALLSAGFDRDMLMKMQTGECDTSSTLWYLLLENMTTETESPPNTFASAIEKRSLNAVDCAIQTSPPASRRNSLDEQTRVKPYPKPVAPSHIQTVGFGSTPQNEKTGWLSSVKSWFGTKPPSAPSTTTSNDYNDVTMTTPTYRSGSQKYRRKVLQLSEPPVSELDQLDYNGTTIVPKSIRVNTSLPAKEFNKPITSPVVVPPTALTSARMVADTFSILSEASEPKEVDICEKRYSMMHLAQQPTPPPSPPVVVSTDDLIPTPVICPIEKIAQIQKTPPLPSLDTIEKPIATTLPFKPRSSRFEFTPRNKLSAYGAQESRALPMASKTIIEEEEEE